MKIIRYINKIFLCLWAVSVLWIMIGSLVNFHQHKIWGKPLLSQFMCTKREKEETLDIQKLLNKDIPIPYSPSPGFLFSQEILQPVSSIRFSYFSGHSFILPVNHCSSSGLRAPPVV